MKYEIETFRLGDICEVVRGGSPRPIIDYITDDEDGVNWLKIGDVNETDKYFTHANERIKRSGISKTREVKSGDLILSNSMSFGRAFITLIDGYIHDGWLRLRCDESTISKEYLYYFLTSSVAQNQFKAVATGSVVNNLKADTVRDTLISVPPLNIQEKIVAVLGTIDKKIVLNNQINNNLLDQAKTLFRSWFIDYLPFNCSKPLDWRIMQLGDVAIMGAGGDKPKTTTATRTEECPYPIFSNGLTDYGLYGYTNEAKVFDESVTVSARGTIGFVCLRHEPYVPIVRLVTLIPKKELMSAKYLYLFLLQTNIAGTGTTQQQLTVPDFKKTEIIIPDNKSMTSFTDIVSPLFNQIWANEEENEGLVQLRDALLPKLMTGEIDVSEIEI